MGILRKLFGGAAGVREAMHETYEKFSKEFDLGQTGEFHEIAKLTDKGKAILTATIQARYLKEWQLSDCLLLALVFPSISELTNWTIDFEASRFFRKRDYRSHLI